MKDKLSPMMENEPVFPMGSVNAGEAGNGEERVTSLANVGVEAFDKEFMTSFEIAELTGKKHKHVMRDIRGLLNQGVCKSNYGLMLNIKQLPNGGKREDPYYKLTKKGCLILASGYNAVLREKIINRWEELEKKERTAVVSSLPDFTNPAIAARAWADQFEKNQALALENHKKQLLLEQKQVENDKLVADGKHKDAEIKEYKPKAAYYDMIMANPSCTKVTSIAQDYGKSPQAFNDLLHELSIQYKVDKQWILYQKYKDAGYVHSKPIPITHHDGHQTVRYLTVWTQKGRLFLYDLLKEKGILPMIERNEKSEAHDK